MIKFTDKKQENLFENLNSIIDQYGITNVLFMLESIAAKNDEDLGEGAPWNSIRESMESSYKDLEEWAISCEVN